MPTINDLRQQAATIKNATQVGENTATRVGTTFETIADLLEGASVGQGVPSVDLSQLNALRTPADQTTANPTIYNVTTLHNLSSTTIKVGTLFIFSDGGRAVVTQILLSNYQVDGGGNISSPNTSQITMYYRMYNIVQETWSAWTLYAGGGGGGTIDPYPVSGSDNAVASNGVFEGLQKAAPEVNINDLDDLGDFVDMRTGESSAYTLKYMHTQSSTWLRVGVVMCFANQAQNTLTQIVFSNCVVDGGGNLIPNSTTNVMNIYYRFKQFSGNPPEGMTIGVWTTWAKFGDSGYQPDNEDIELNASDQLQFANKAYDANAFSGLGRVYLRKNIVELNLTDKYFDGFVNDVLVQDVGTSSTPDEICFDTTRKMFVARVGTLWYLDWSSDEDYNPITRDVNWNYNGNFYRWNGEELAQWDKTINQLTQAMVNTANTIYHIQYDYDLNGQAITLPAGCVLEFEGGSLKNGTIAGNNTMIDAGICKVFSALTFTGTWVNEEAYPEWFGEYGLWTDSENLFVISKSVRLTGATYWSPSSNAPTLRVRGTLFSDCQSEIRIAPPSNDFIGIQLGDPNGTIQTREKRLKLKGISVYLHSLANAQRTAVLGISYTQGLTIENCSFVNSNTRNTTITKSVLDAPADTLNYGIVFYGDATGSSEITTFINSGANGDIAVYFKNEADFVNFYGGGFGCGNYGYGLIYGQQVTNLGFFGVSFNQGIRQIHVVTENPQKDATSGMMLENCRFEQLYYGTIEDDVDGGDAFYASCVLTFELSHTNSAYLYGLYCANTQFPMGTKLRITNNKMTYISFVNCWCLSIDTRTPIDVAGCEYINLMFDNVRFVADNVNINTSASQIVENISVAQPSSSVTRYIFRNLRITRNTAGDRRTSGANSQSPTIPTGEEKGFQYYNQSISRPQWWNGSGWKDHDGYTFALKRGNSTQRPSTLTSNDTGFYYWDTALKKPLFLREVGSTRRWADGLGRQIDYQVYGTNRPSWTAEDVGQMYFDTSLGKPIFWNGTGWVDATGTAV